MVRARLLGVWKRVVGRSRPGTVSVGRQGKGMGRLREWETVRCGEWVSDEGGCVEGGWGGLQGESWVF